MPSVVAVKLSLSVFHLNYNFTATTEGIPNKFLFVLKVHLFC